MTEPKEQVPLKERLERWFHDQTAPAAWSDLLHVAALIGALVIVRPLILAEPPQQAYEGTSTLWRLAELDWDLLARAARRKAPAVPRLLFLLVPTLAFVLAKRKLRWTDWEHGRRLRALVMVVVAMLTWSGSTGDYNLFFDRLHGWDRLALVACGIASWFTPLAVPFAARIAYILIKEAYHPIPQDDFDFRPTLELLAVFSAFAWLSLKRTFKPKHFLVVGMAMYASYYFLAGVAKYNYATDHAWLYHDHVTNLGMGGHVRGWLGFVPDSVLLPIYEGFFRIDQYLAWYVLALELGALFLCFIHPKVTRWWFASAFSLHFGIVILSGVFFWKWMVVCVAFFFWLPRAGEPILRGALRYKLVGLLAVLSIYSAGNRLWYYPTTGVAWFDTRLTQNYEIIAVGESGQRYLVDPNYFAPSDMHFVQGRMCYVGPSRQTTGIYGVAGSLPLTKALDEADSVDVARRFLARGRVCRGKKQDKRRQAYVEFITTFFANLNRHGERPWALLRWIGRPTHLHVQPQGELFDAQEKVVTVELWHQAVFWHAGELHRFERKRVHELPIAQGD